MHESLWAKNTALPEFPALRGEIKTDVLIIGGGMAGILCAHELHRAGVDYVLLEAERICGGVTKNTTAKITAQHGLCYHKLLKKFGSERAAMYLKANLDALEKYRAMCRDMDCDFEEKDSFVYSVYDRQKPEKEMAALAELNFPAEFVREVPLPVSSVGAVKFPRQAQFDPLKFVRAVAQGLNIYERTPVRELAGRTAVTGHGRVKAENIVVATHFPFLNKHGSYFLKLYQHRSYVIALENAGGVGGMYVDEAEKGLSFRSSGKMLLLGGGDHRTGKTGGGWTELEAFAAAHYPGAAVKYRWATQDCMSLDSVPYIGQYSATTSGLYVATGFNKWGMTSSMAAATILRDLLLGRHNPYASVFSPSRSMLRPQLAVNGFEAAVNLLTPTAPRCPHMGCALKWNPTEHSWDCPCHGSRFTREGGLLDGPATGDLKKRQ